MQPHGCGNNAGSKAGETGDKGCRELCDDKKDQIKSEKVTHCTRPIGSAAIAVAAAIGQRLANYRLRCGCLEPAPMKAVEPQPWSTMRIKRGRT